MLVEAADMGDPDAQYELGCRLRVEVRLPALCTCIKYMLSNLNLELQTAVMGVFFFFFPI